MVHFYRYRTQIYLALMSSVGSGNGEVPEETGNEPQNCELKCVASTEYAACEEDDPIETPKEVPIKDDDEKNAQQNPSQENSDSESEQEEEPRNRIFETDTQLEKLHLLNKTYPKPVLPTPQEPSDVEDDSDSESGVASIDNHNPNKPRRFNDPLTRQACYNCGVRMEDIVYPKKSDVAKYTTDPEMIEMVKEELKARVDRTIQMVKEERDRLAAEKDLTTSRNMGIPRQFEGRKESEFARMERERIRRIEDRNRREAEQAILNILIIQEFEQETREEAERERRLREDHELAVRKKRMLERKRQLRRIRELEEQELARQAAEQERRKEELEHERAFEKRKCEIEEARKQRYQVLEQTRRAQNEKARKLAEEKEKARQKEYEEMRIKLQIREDQIRIRREQEQKEKQRQARLLDEQKQKRVELVRQKQRELLEEKRLRTEEKQRRQEEGFRMEQILRDKRLEETRKRNHEKQEEGEKRRREIQEKRFNDIQTNFEEKEAKSASVLEHQIKEAEKKRARDALISRMHKEESYQKAERNAKLKMCRAVESAVQYENRLKAIELKEEQRKKQRKDAELTRIQLEREKDKILRGGTTQSELSKLAPKNLQKIADQYGIDMEALMQKAKAARRGVKRSPVVVAPRAQTSLNTSRKGTTKPC